MDVSGGDEFKRKSFEPECKCSFEVERVYVSMLKWSLTLTGTAEPHIEGGCYQPLDLESRSVHDEPPKHVVECVKDTLKGLNDFGQSPENLAAQPLEDFPQFSNLPLEVRRQVWYNTFPGTRLVEIIYDDYDGVCRSSCTPPIALWICQESRIEVLRFYKLMFATEWSDARIYFNPRVDELYLGAGNFEPEPKHVLEMFESMETDDIGAIESLVIDYDLANDNRGGLEGVYLSLWWKLSQMGDKATKKYVFNRLQNLTFVNIKSHRGCNDSEFTNFASDIVLGEVEYNPGEFQAWNVSPSPNPVSKVDSYIHPWKLPLGICDWAIPVSDFWRKLEAWKAHNGYMSLRTVRFVALHNLQYSKRWEKRARFLEKSIYVQWSGCIYELTDDLKQLLYSKIFDTETYAEIGVRLTERVHQYLDVDDDVEPLEAYLSDEICCCGSGHVKQLAFYHEDVPYFGELYDIIYSVLEDKKFREVEEQEEEKSTM